MGINFGAIGKALLFTASPITEVAARGVELVSGKDDIVRNNPLDYYKDVFTRSKPAAQTPAGGASQPAGPMGPDGYKGIMSYEEAVKAIDQLAGT